MTKRDDFLALKAECERLAKAEEQDARRIGATDEERLVHMDLASAYRQMASAQADSALYAEMARPDRFTGKACGVRKLTIERSEFLASIATKIGTKKHEAIAAEAVSTYAKQVRILWKAQGKSATSKILNFIKNHGID